MTLVSVCVGAQVRGRPGPVHGGAVRVPRGGRPAGRHAHLPARRPVRAAQAGRPLLVRDAAAAAGLHAR